MYPVYCPVYILAQKKHIIRKCPVLGLPHGLAGHDHPLRLRALPDGALHLLRNPHQVRDDDHHMMNDILTRGGEMDIIGLSGFCKCTNVQRVKLIVM